jgi:hypothetical protein
VRGICRPRMKDGVTRVTVPCQQDEILERFAGRVQL